MSPNLAPRDVLGTTLVELGEKDPNIVVLDADFCTPGKTIAFKAKEIAGPRPFACTTPHYKISDFTADLIFQGAFEQMQSNNKSVDPNKIAASLGFLGNSIRTLETGCEIDSFRRRHHRGNRSQRLRIYAKEAVAAISRFCDAMRRAWIRASFAGWISCIRRRSAGCCSLFS